MAFPMAREEDEIGRADTPECERIRRLSPGACNAPFVHAFKTRQIIDARSANDAEYRLAHISFELRELRTAIGGMLLSRRSVMPQPLETER